MEERHAFPGALRALGGVGAISGLLAGNRGAPWLRRGVPSAGGCGGHFGAARGQSRRALASPGRAERWGVWGAISGLLAGNRGAAWLRRGAPSAGGCGGPSRGSPRPNAARPGGAGGSAALGGGGGRLGAARGATGSAPGWTGRAAAPGR